MCGRLVNLTDAERLAEMFGADLPINMPRLRQRWNVPPSAEVYVIGDNPIAGRRGIAVMSWGLVPYWWQGTRKEAVKPSNARGETVAASPMFRESFARRRCIVPADGYYEWTRAGKVPHAFRPAGDRVFALGGIWDSWDDTETGEKRNTFAVVTTEPNELAASIHDRMPVIRRRPATLLMGDTRPVEHR